MTASNEMKLLRLYETAFDRPADKAGLAHHLSLLEKGVDFREIARSFAASEEFKARNQYVSNDIDVVKGLIWNALERDLSRGTQEFSGWEKFLSSATVGDAIYAIADSVEIVGSDVTWVL